MSLSTWLITGASRGLGLELCRQILSTSATDIVFAACRNPESAAKLKELHTTVEPKDRLIPVQLDVTNETSIKNAAASVGKVLKDKSLRLDYLLNNAGAAFARDTAIDMKPETFIDTVKTNVIGPVLVAQSFIPLMEYTASDAQGARAPVVMNMSSSLGSIACDKGSFVASYSISKTALNMLSYKLSKDKPSLIVIAGDPGWNKTDMGGETAELDPQFTMSQMTRTLRALKPEDTGKFLRYDGEIMPW